MEKNGNGNTVLLTVIGVATLLVALVGATFAYFTATVSGNDSQKVSVQAAEPTGLTYTADTASLALDKAIPGDSDEKTFTIANNDANNSYKYDLSLVIDLNSFNADDGEGQLMFSFAGTSNKSGVTITPVNATYDATGKGNNDKVAIVTGQKIASNETHTYTVGVEFVDLDKEQNANAIASLSGHFTVENTQTANVLE